MAFDYFSQDEEKDQAAQEGAPQQLGQESPIIGSQNQSAQQAGQGEGTKSGSFTNLQSYLDANSGLKFGEQVAGKIQGDVDKANQTQASSEQGFKDAANQGSVDADENLYSKVRQDATQVVGNQADKEAFEKRRDASYQGPRSFAEKQDLYTNAYRDTEAAGQRANAVDNEGGRKAYLEEVYGSGRGRYDYTSGQKNLDNFLIQNDPNHRAALDRVKSNAAESKSNFEGLSNKLAAYAKQREDATKAARAGARGAVGIDDAGNFLELDNVRGNAGAMQDAIESLDETVNSRRTALAADRAAIEGAYGKGNVNELSAEARQRFGLDAANFGGFRSSIPNMFGSNDPSFSSYHLDDGSMVGLDPRDYSTLLRDSDLNRGSIADRDQMAKIEALAALAGKDQTYISNPQDAGTMTNTPNFTARGADITSQAATRKAAMASELAATLDRLKKAAGSGQLLSGDSIRAEGNAIRAKYGLPPI